MIEHLVLFKFKKGSSDEVIKDIYSSLQRLKGRIDSLVEISAGANFSERSQGFDGGLTVRFNDKAGLMTYAEHPEHQEIVQNKIKPIAESVLALDYEF